MGSREKFSSTEIKFGDPKKGILVLLVRLNSDFQARWPWNSDRRQSNKMATNNIKMDWNCGITWTDWLPAHYMKQSVLIFMLIKGSPLILLPTERTTPEINPGYVIICRMPSPKVNHSGICWLSHQSMIVTRRLSAAEGEGSSSFSV